MFQNSGKHGNNNQLETIKHLSYFFFAPFAFFHFPKLHMSIK